MVEVGRASGHRSACWLPPELAGLGADVDQARQRYALAHRSARAASLPGVEQAQEVLAGGRGRSRP